MQAWGQESNQEHLLDIFAKLKNMEWGCMEKKSFQTLHLKSNQSLFLIILWWLKVGIFNENIYLLFYVHM